MLREQTTSRLFTVACLRCHWFRMLRSQSSTLLARHALIGVYPHKVIAADSRLLVKLIVSNQLLQSVNSAAYVPCRVFAMIVLYLAK